MKILMTLCFIFSLSAFGSTGETRRANYDGSQENVELLLRGTKTHTEYRYEEVARTCYRRVFSHYERVCRTRYRQQCHTTPRRCRTVCTDNPRPRPTPRPTPRPRPRPRPRNAIEMIDSFTNTATEAKSCRQVCSGGNRVCRSVPYTHCDRIPRYRQVPYTCYETVRIPYEVFDYETEALVQLVVKNNAHDTSVNETITATLNGESLDVSFTGNGNVIAFLDNQSSNSRMDNGVKYIYRTYHITLENADNYTAPVSRGVKNIHLSDYILEYDIGHVLQPETLRVKASVKRGLFKKQLFDGLLNKNQYQLIDRGDHTRVVIDLRNLGINKLKKVKHFFELNHTLVLSRRVLSGRQATNGSANGSYSVRPGK